MNNIASREAIGDDEFNWIENIIPVAAGAAYPVLGSIAGPTVAEATSPTYACPFSVGVGATPSATITGITATSTGHIPVIFTIFTVTAVNSFTVGQQITVSGVSYTGASAANPNGTWTIASANSTGFTYNNFPGPPPGGFTYVSGGVANAAATSNSGNFAFVVFATSGNGYVVNLQSPYSWTLIISGLTSGQTFATPYNNQGLLIIDPTGYWDWNVTAPNTLTPQNNAAANATLTGVAKALAGGTSLKQIVTASGTGATFQAVYTVINVALVSGGTGYAVGDTVYLTDGSPTIDATLTVSTVGAGGAITAVFLTSGGSYPGPPTSALVATGPTGTATSTTGSGTSATFSCHIQAIAMNILTRGNGYTGTTTVVDETSTPVVIDTWNITSSGVIGGTSIATYAGRVWIGASRTVYFTDIDSYNSFGGVGGSFAIPDAYLVGPITVLYTANNYLYIFGQTSIDALSNVTVSGGVTFFSRINITGSVGCSAPSSVFSYYRGIAFWNVAGIYLLTGATPEKISEKIAGIVQAVANSSQIYGGTVVVRGEICAVMQVAFADTITQSGAVRPLNVLFFRGRWWSYSFAATPGFPTTACVTVPVNGVMTLYGFRCNGTTTALYACLSPLAALSNWVLKTKLWDAGAPLREKQALNAAIAANWVATGASGVTFNIDTELSSVAATAVPVNQTGYDLLVGSANNASTEGAQYLGLTVSGSSNVTQIRMLALQGKADRNILAA